METVYLKPSQLSPSIQYCTLPPLETSSSTLGSSQLRLHIEFMGLSDK